MAQLPFKAARDGAIAALIAGLLALPLVGFRLVDQSGGEGLANRWPQLVAMIILVFVGRLALSLISGGAVRSVLFFMAAFAIGSLIIPWPSQFLEVVAVGGAALIAMRAAFLLLGSRPFGSMSGAVGLAGRYAPWAMIAFAALLPLLPFANRGVLDTGVMILTYVLLGWGLNIVTGLAGLLDLGYAAFFAIGAYTAANSGQHVRLFVLGLPPAGGGFCFGGGFAAWISGTASERRLFCHRDAWFRGNYPDCREQLAIPDQRLTRNRGGSPPELFWDCGFYR